MNRGADDKLNDALKWKWPKLHIRGFGIRATIYRVITKESFISKTRFIQKYYTYKYDWYMKITTKYSSFMLTLQMFYVCPLGHTTHVSFLSFHETLFSLCLHFGRDWAELVNTWSVLFPFKPENDLSTHYQNYLPNIHSFTPHLLKSMTNFIHFPAQSVKPMLFAGAYREFHFGVLL